MKKRWNLIFLILLFAAFGLLLYFGEETAEGVRQGLYLSYRAVIPALFPAAVLCALIGEQIEWIPLPPAFSLWVIAQICGFPLGIKTVARA